MPSITVKRTATKATGRDIGTGNVVTLTKTTPTQLSLFQTFLDDDCDPYSNTIEFYDVVPKYFASKKRMAELRKDGTFLPTLTRDFRYNDAWYTVEITPARLKDKGGVEKEYYPTQREELVEEALKKIACDELHGVFLNGEAGVQFTLWELREELHRQGHGMSWPDLIDALQICRKSSITITGKDTPSELYLSSSIFPVLSLVSRRDWEENPKQTRCYVQFNPLVTHSLNKLTYRQFNYITFMGLTRQLSRYLFKRLSHVYTNAAWDHPYHIRLSTLVRDTQLINAKRVRDQVRYVDAVMAEFKEKRILSSFDKDVRTAERNAIVDVKYTLYPDIVFTGEIKKANRRNQNILHLAIEHGVLTQRQLAERAVVTLKD
jgi:hypothetical protein